MKKVKTFEQYHEGNEKPYVSEEGTTISEEESNKLEEANPDGTISDDEDERRDELEMEIYQQAESLINYLKEEAEAIGGPFRSPGIIADCVKQIKDAFRKNKIKL